MKTRLIFLLPLLWVLIGCSDSDSDSATLEISQSIFNDVNSEGATIKVSITCNSTWRTSSNQSWCIPNQQSSSNDGELVLTIHANTTSEERSATVTIMAKKTNKTIKITQSPSTNIASEHHYKLPVIFHVLYKDRNDEDQYIAEGRLAQIINACNLIYKNKIYRNANNNISQDMNLEFVMATEKPDGSPLEEAGVERIEWETSSMSCEQFMDGKDKTQAKKYAEMLWNPRVYINIFVYPFSENNILGIAHLPYCLSSYPLDGLNNGDYFLSHEVEYPHCVSINSQYIYVNGDSQYYYTADVYNTLAHELGHYLGLHHAFSEDGDNTDLCEDTDFCTDTPTYNITKYRELIRGMGELNKYPFAELCTRTDCSGDTFISRNIMDYAYCYSDQFTSQQRNRIRHVLSYSPLIPGVKKYTSTDTRSLSCEEQPPIQFKY
ncbi:zinc-dependent metalloproteinase lipoprotein [uncultured Bacteroides sp.]|jgi:zinc-dependent metalloproteinase lipoprotein|uniref:zinc-dependent metalloproteinase lipoprotein n=1 Tax=uncultured Bacteroides sp. TaxID=162156 RepID=UPI0025882BD2|nr:zinc-dependent metalloproteinase lipoprotein [uncultured Bacteroides sp.]